MWAAYRLPWTYAGRRLYVSIMGLFLLAGTWEAGPALLPLLPYSSSKPKGGNLLKVYVWGHHIPSLSLYYLRTLTARHLPLYRTQNLLQKNWMAPEKALMPGPNSLQEEYLISYWLSVFNMSLKACGLNVACQYLWELSALSFVIFIDDSKMKSDICLLTGGTLPIDQNYAIKCNLAFNGPAPKMQMVVCQMTRL